jgi:hypothetical protein
MEITFNRTLPFRSSGLGRFSIFGRLSRGAVTSISPNTSIMMATIMSCCVCPQWISAEMITGKGDVTKAYLAMATQISRTDTFEVSVLPW